ncbi:MAG: ABC transporter permease [Actinobacteria bacterium]|nr:ABC transporter permease [Actinomycetota bacterium]
MTLLHITAKNIRLHSIKVAILLAGLGIGVATVVGLLSVSAAMRNDIQDKIDEYGANMVLTPKSKSLPLSYGGLTLGGFTYDQELLTEDDAAKIRTIKNAANINIVAPKLMGLAEVNGQRAIIVGARLKDEFKLKKWWKVFSGKAPRERDEILVGGRAAQTKGLRVGDAVDIGGKRLKVAGVLGRVGSQEDDLIYMDLKQAQNVLGKPGAVSMIETSAWCKNCPIDEIARQTREKIPGAKTSAVRQVAKSRDAVVDQFFGFAALLSGTMVAVAGLVVFANVLANVRERRREIGIFRAVGYRKRHVLMIILSESILIGLVAGLVGWAIGFGAARFIGPVVAGLDVAPGFDWRLAGTAVFAPALISLIASLYPALAAANTDPAEALKAL